MRLRADGVRGASDGARLRADGARLRADGVRGASDGARLRVVMVRRRRVLVLLWLLLLLAAAPARLDGRARGRTSLLQLSVLAVVVVGQLIHQLLVAGELGLERRDRLALAGDGAFELLMVRLCQVAECLLVRPLLSGESALEVLLLGLQLLVGRVCKFVLRVRLALELVVLSPQFVVRALAL